MAVCPGATARADTTPALSTTIPVPGGAGPGAPVAPDAPVAPVAPLPVAPVAPVAPLPVAPVAPIAPVAPAPVAPVAPAPVAPVAPAPAGPVAPVEPTRPTGPVAPVAPPPPPPLGQGSGVIPWRSKYDRDNRFGKLRECGGIERRHIDGSVSRFPYGLAGFFNNKDLQRVWRIGVWRNLPRFVEPFGESSRYGHESCVISFYGIL